MMKKAASVLLCLLLVLTTLTGGVPVQVSAEENGRASCTLSLGGDVITSSAKMAVQVTVSIDDEELRSHALYLSYHFYSPDGELLYYEGDRTPISGWVDGKIEGIPVVIDLSLIEPVARVKHLLISFDIVDMTGNSWLSENPDVDLSSETIEYNGSQLMKFRESAQMALRRPVALLINTVIFIAAIIFVVKFKKAGIFT